MVSIMRVFTIIYKIPPIRLKILGLQIFAFWVFIKTSSWLGKQKHLEICAKISSSICYSQYPQILMEVGYHSFGEEKLKVNM
jgi:hypothetical protein